MLSKNNNAGIDSKMIIFSSVMCWYLLLDYTKPLARVCVGLLLDYITIMSPLEKAHKALELRRQYEAAETREERVRLAKLLETIWKHVNGTKYIAEVRLY